MGTFVRSDRVFGPFGQCFRQGYRPEKGRESVPDQEREQRDQHEAGQEDQPGVSPLPGGVAALRGGGVRGGEADIMCESFL